MNAAADKAYPTVAAWVGNSNPGTTEGQLDVRVSEAVLNKLLHKHLTERSGEPWDRWVGQVNATLLQQASTWVEVDPKTQECFLALLEHDLHVSCEEPLAMRFELQQGKRGWKLRWLFPLPAGALMVLEEDADPPWFGLVTCYFHRDTFRARDSLQARRLTIRSQVHRYGCRFDEGPEPLFFKHPPSAAAPVDENDRDELHRKRLFFMDADWGFDSRGSWSFDRVLSPEPKPDSKPSFQLETELHERLRENTEVPE